jgi:hypothetical protein
VVRRNAQGEEQEEIPNGWNEGEGVAEHEYDVGRVELRAGGARAGGREGVGCG